MLFDYKVKIAQLENITYVTKFLQDQLSLRLAFDNWKWKQGVSQLTDEVDHSRHDMVTF